MDKPYEPGPFDPTVYYWDESDTCVRIDDRDTSHYELACGSFAPEYDPLLRSARLQGKFESRVYETYNPQPIQERTMVVDFLWEADRPLAAGFEDYRWNDFLSPPAFRVCLRMGGRGGMGQGAQVRGSVESFFGLIQIESGQGWLSRSADAEMRSYHGDQCLG